MTENQDKQSRYMIHSIEKALDLIEILSEKESASLMELVEILQQPKSSLYRIILTLENKGYITRSDEDGKYCLGYKHLTVTKNLLEKNTLRSSAIPEMNALVDQYGDTVNLGVLSDDEVLYLEIIEGTYALRMTDRVGSKAPIHATAMGKVMTAFFREDMIKELLENLNMHKITPHTITDKQRFIEEMDKVRLQGYALDDQEVVEGARCVAAPIFDMFDRLVGAISLSGAIHRLSDERLPDMIASVTGAAERISLKLGCTRSISQRKGER